MCSTRTYWYGDSCSNKTATSAPAGFHGLGAYAGAASVAPIAIAIAASALFGLHAVHTEAVSQITGRAELIATLAALGAALLHVAAFPAEAEPRPRARVALRRAGCVIGACVLGDRHVRVQ